MPEIGVRDELSPDKIKAIFVPEENVKFTKKIIGNSDIKIGAIDVKDRFFSFDQYGGTIYIDDEKFAQLQANKKQQRNLFAPRSLMGLALSRRKKDLLSAKNLFKNICKGKLYENSREDI